LRDDVGSSGGTLPETGEPERLATNRRGPTPRQRTEALSRRRIYAAGARGNPGLSLKENPMSDLDEFLLFLQGPARPIDPAWVELKRPWWATLWQRITRQPRIRVYQRGH
jgi:hypothetical protein